MFVRDKPFNELPMLPPKREIETKPILKKVISARTALESLKQAGKTIPNQAVLLRSIVLQEARSSSEIENIVTTDDELYKAFSQTDLSDDPHAREILRYADAIWYGHKLVASKTTIGAEEFCQLASIIKESRIGIRTSAGTRIGNPSTGQVIYTPPEGTGRLQYLLENLVQFQAETDEFDPLVKIAIGHYQFEAIHPFIDGNGRTGRVLNIIWMLEKELLELPVLFLSRAIIDSKSEYYGGLRSVTERQEWEAWVAYFLDLVEITAIETRRRIELIHRMVNEAAELVRAQLPNIYSKELIDLVFSQPYTRIRFLEEAGIAKRQTASGYLKKLEAVGLLRSHITWRDTIYVNDALMNALS